MKTLSITEARKNLGRLCEAAGRGEAVGIISGSRIFQLKAVAVVAWDDTYAAREYGVTAEEMDAFTRRAEAEITLKEKRGGYVYSKGKFDPKSMA
jgi:hypothetical protein